MESLCRRRPHRAAWPPSQQSAAALRPIRPDAHKHSLPALMLGAIGVVYGDIGTSPLYAMKESFIGPHPLAVDPLHIFGVLSLIFWSLMLIVTLKYVLVAMRADNQGRGRLVRAARADLAQPRRQEWTVRPGRARRACDRLVLRRRDDHAGHLGAVGGRGPDDRQPGLRPPRAADLGRHPDRPVPRPVARHGAGRRDLRPDRARLFRGAGDARRRQHRAAARKSSGSSARIGRCASSSTTRSSPSSPWARCSSP